MDAIKLLSTCLAISLLTSSCSDNQSSLSNKWGGESSYVSQLAFLRDQCSLLYDGFPDYRFFLFGMGNRRKMVYVNKQLKDYFTDSVYMDFSDGFLSDSIMPDKYEVKINTLKVNYSIRENEKGVFLNDSLLPNTQAPVNLPDFKEYTFDKVMKVALQEVLFNIKNSEVFPNFVYKQHFYRDAAYSAMVLKETGNIQLIKPWVTKLTDVYDHARGSNVNETDSPGQLLYLLSFFPNDCQALREKIMREVNRIKRTDRETGKFFISGPVDGKVRANYSTKWLLFGMKANGMSIDNWIVPDASDDNYADLFWMDFDKDGTKFNKIIWQAKVWFQRPFSDNIVAFPYLNIARAHYYNDPSFLMMNKLAYPLSWEGGSLENSRDFRKEGSFTHTWAAAELFLYLSQFKKQ